MTGSERKVVLSVGARLGVGGMGNGAQKIAAGLESAGLLGHVICAGAPPEPPWPSTVVDIERLVRILRWTPARFRTSLMLTCCEAYFDLLASRLVGTGDVFFGWTNRALHSMRKAKARGMLCVVHAANLHIREAATSAAGALAQAGSRNNPFGRWMVRRILAEYRRADLVRVESTLTRDTLIRGGVPGDKIALIPPPADLEKFRPQPAEKTGPFTIGYVGFLSVLKGFHYLVRGFAELELPNANLLLHGGPVDRVTKRMMVRAVTMPGVLVARGDVRATTSPSAIRLPFFPWPLVPNPYLLDSPLSPLTSRGEAASSRPGGPKDQEEQGLTRCAWRRGGVHEFSPGRPKRKFYHPGERGSTRTSRCPQQHLVRCPGDLRRKNIVCDINNRVMFRDDHGNVADVNQLMHQPHLIAAAAPGRVVRGIPCTRYFLALDHPKVFSRTGAQQLWPRLKQEVERFLGARHG